MRRLTPGGAGVARGGIAWAGSDQLVCSQPESVAGQQTSTSSRVVALQVASGKSRPLLASPNVIRKLDVLGPGRLLLETRSLRQSLREVPLRSGADTAERWLTHGNAADRQPVYAPDGEWITFSSNRTGNLDLWAASRRSGAVRRLTDDPAHDSDPAFMPDGKLLWSSNRSGRFEVWLAEVDGSGARQVTRDGVDAENPVATPDGRWILYLSANPLSGANILLPEVSPDGRFVAFVTEAHSEGSVLRVASIENGSLTPFSVGFPRPTPGTTIDQGSVPLAPGRQGARLHRARSGGEPRRLPGGVHARRRREGHSSAADWPGSRPRRGIARDLSRRSLAHRLVPRAALRPDAGGGNRRPRGASQAVGGWAMPA